MRTYLILFFCLFFSHTALCLFKADSTIIYIENSSGTSINIQSENSPEIHFEDYTSAKKRDTLVFRTSEPFRLVFKESKNASYIYYTVLFNPSEKVTVFRDNKGFRLKSDNEIRNNELNFFIEMQKEVGNFDGLIDYIKHKRKNVDSLYQKVNELYEKRVTFLEKYKIKHSISDEFEKNVRKILKNKQRYNFLDHAQLTGIYNKDLFQNQEVSQLILSIFEEENSQDIYFLEALAHASRLKYLDKNLEEYYQNIKEIYSGAIRDYLLFRIVGLSYSENYIGKLTEDYLEVSTNEAFKREILEEYGDYIGESLKLNKPTYDLTKVSMLYHLKSGNYITWNQLLAENKAMYIDFWATWCGGCRQALPKVKQLAAEYAPKGLRTIYISMDTNTSAWAKTSNKEQIPEEDSYLLLDSRDSFISKKHTISPIPRYMFTDKNGNLVNDKAPSTNDSSLKEELENLVNN